jgi:hypothetical protein
MYEGLGFGKKKLINEIILSNWGLKDITDKRQYTYNELLFIIQEMLEQEGKAYLQGKGHSNIMRGFNVFRNFVELLMYRNIANYDSMILITSEKGSGKSSAAMMIARQWCKLLGIKFSPERHMAYNNADLMRKIDNLNSFEPVICDEAVRFVSSEDWSKKENKQLKKKLAQVRTKHLLYILCFPLKVYKVEKTYLENYVNYWLDIYSRGEGVIYVKNKNPVHDTWGMAYFKNVASYTEFTNKSRVLEALKKHPNFWINIRFPKVPPWLYEKYLKIREKNVYDDDAVLSSVSKEDIHNAALILALRDIMMNDSTLTMNRIILHIRNEMDLQLSKAQVQAAIEDAKQLIFKVREKAISLD